MRKKGLFLLSPAEEEERFGRVLDAMAGRLVASDRPSRVETPFPGELERLWRVIEGLEQRVAELEAKPPRSFASRKCPRCGHLAVDVVATRPHPELGDEGIKLQEIVCGRCGHRDSRLYDPNSYIC